MKSVGVVSSNPLLIVNWSQSLAITSTFSDFVIFHSSSLLFRVRIKGGSGKFVQVQSSTTRVVDREDNQTWRVLSALSFTLYIVVGIKDKINLIFGWECVYCSCCR